MADALAAVVVYEPAVFETIDEETFTAMGATIVRMNEEVNQGRPTEAARQFVAFAGNDDELAALVADDLHESTAPNHLADLRVLGNVDPTAPSATDPAALATITAPVLALQGDRPALAWFSTWPSMYPTVRSTLSPAPVIGARYSHLSQWLKRSSASSRRAGSLTKLQPPSDRSRQAGP